MVNRTSTAKWLTSRIPPRYEIAVHCIIGYILRTVFVFFSMWQDKSMNLQFTDVDYHVFSQAAAKVLNAQSPYDVGTYRYSPAFAYLMIPNTYLNFPSFGKLIATVLDTYLAFWIYKIVKLVYSNESKALVCAKLWLYNPIPIIISARGNLDSLSTLFILFAIYYQYKNNPVFAGITLAVGAHLRLYPIIYVPLFALTSGRLSSHYTLKKTIVSKVKFIALFAITLASITKGFEHLYGFKYIESSILYHVKRMDIRHNLSLYFYVQYLSLAVPEQVAQHANALSPDFYKNLLIVVPTIVGLLFVYAKYNTLKDLHFAVFCATYIFVTYNRVITTQYYIWYLSLLPLFLPSITLIKRSLILITFSWLVANATSLYFAYQLEFLGKEVYEYIHAANGLILLTNVVILTTFIHSYNAQNGKKKIVKTH